MPAAAAQPPSIHTAMRYSVFAGGKRIRPILCLETARIFAADVVPALHPACAMEFIHTYSLIHDDLPALDNDDLRAANPLATRNSVKLSHPCRRCALDSRIRNHWRNTHRRRPPRRHPYEVAAAAGTINGMVGGQVADIEAEGKPVDPQMLEYIHARKPPR